MNKEIEEMMLDVPQNIVAYDGNPVGQHLYGEQRQEIAEALYNAGYRKIDENCAVIMKTELKEYKRQAVKEFADELKAIIAEKGTLVRDYTGDKLVLRREVDVDEALESIDELFEEVFGNDEKQR